MASVPELTDDEKRFLETYLPAAGQQHVTLTYACSLDGMVALAPGVRTRLSGPKTQSMTHFLRLHHDAIIVGAGTAIADDPSLNCRYPGSTINDHPTPIVIDGSGRFTGFHLQSSKMARLASENEGKSPRTISVHERKVVLNSSSPTTSHLSLISNDDLANLRAMTGFHETGKIPWEYLLKGLRECGFNSIMIEGGASIINELLSQPALVDSVVITIAPTWLGQGGLAMTPLPKKDGDGQRINAANLADTAWRQFGQDVVLCGRLGAAG